MSNNYIVTQRKRCEGLIEVSCQISERCARCHRSNIVKIFSLSDLEAFILLATTRIEPDPCLNFRLGDDDVPLFQTIDLDRGMNSLSLLWYRDVALTMRFAVHLSLF